jgi:tRNA 2-thiouridine synthesizing protein E|tara:strand:+ start:586 stop:900 length:315 start_codon:yes stop_codon:yes gene_type:complete
VEIKIKEKINFLRKLADWSEKNAEELSVQENLLLTSEHLEILILAREFYAEYGFSPSMRPLIKTIGIKLSTDKAHSIYLMRLFPKSPAKIIAKLAGLPKPRNCL